MIKVDCKSNKARSKAMMSSKTRRGGRSSSGPSPSSSSSASTAKKSAASSKNVNNKRRSNKPGPPARRPTIPERISMLQMAYLQHTNYIPHGGRLVIPLGLLQVEPKDSSGEVLPQVTRRHRSRLLPMLWKKQVANDGDDASGGKDQVTVRLLSADA